MVAVGSGDRGIGFRFSDESGDRGRGAREIGVGGFGVGKRLRLWLRVNESTWIREAVQARCGWLRANRRSARDYASGGPSLVSAHSFMLTSSSDESVQ